MYNFPKIDVFLESWNRTDLYKVDYTIVKSELEKNGRVCSDVATLSGPILAKNDENFLATLEVGIVDLIRIMINDYGLITIGSCEWHKHLSTTHNISKRFAKVLWRNKDEYKKNYPILKQIADDINKWFKNVKIAFFDFEEEFPNWQIYHLCFMVFIPFDSDVDIYFSEVDEISESYNRALTQAKNEISVPPDHQNL